MSVIEAPRRSSVAERRFGYTISIAINAAVLYVINVTPGWAAVPFLSAESTRVIPLVNASVIAGVIVNLAYLALDPRWLVSLGSVVTTGIGAAALVRIWHVFPFDFADGSIDWSLIVRVVLVVGIVGSVIGMLAQLASLIGSNEGQGSAQPWSSARPAYHDRAADK